MADRALLGVLEVARSVVAELDLEVVLERVLAAAQELTQARYAALGIVDESRTGLARFLTVGISEDERAEIGDLPSGRGVLGELIERPQPLRLSRVGLHPRSWGFPPGHPPMETFLGVPIVVGDRPFGNLYLTEKEGGADFTPQDEQAVTLLAEFAAVAIDHAGRYTGARQRGDELERINATLDATAQIARAVGGETDLGLILELVAKRGRALVAARTLLVELVRGDELEVATAAGEFPPEVLGARLPLDETVASAALRTRRTQRLEEELNRSRFEQHGLGRFGLEAASGLVVPLVFRNQAYGVLVALDRLEHGPRFNSDDQRLLEAFAASAATAVATATSVAAEHQRQRLAAAEAERSRWARELHDDTLQELAALRLRLSAARRAGDREALDRAADDAIDTLQEQIAGVRSLITDLRPAVLDEHGAGGALESLAQRAGRDGFEVELHLDPAFECGRAATRHTEELEAGLTGSFRRRVTNAGKHGGAQKARVDVVEDETAVKVTVSDDGAGFDPGAVRGGFGLLGMRERVELLGGTLRIDSTPGGGTTLEISLPPMRRPAAGETAGLRSVGI